MAKWNVLLICGGGSTEHEISLISASYIEESLAQIPEVTPHLVTIEKDGTRTYKDGRKCELRKAGELIVEDETIYLNYAIPCIHGPPGETGEIQAVFEMMGLPYLGCGPMASTLCFDKTTTKFWLDALGIPNTPFVFVRSGDDSKKSQAMEFAKKHGEVFVKAATQGSSVGCYHVKDPSQVWESVQEASKFGRTILIEQAIKGRELEISVYETPDLRAAGPGEILCGDGFYSYDEKYSKDSKTETATIAENIGEEIKSKIQQYAKDCFVGLGCKDLARVDFFLTDDNQIYLNEINTFPGMTPISMFPKMMESQGDKFVDYLKERITSNVRK